jgi:hypothetical protein
MTGELLEYIFEHVIIPEGDSRRKDAQIGLEVPAIIFTDGHNSRASPAVFYLAMTHNILLICIYPHLSHLIQPNDRGVNAAFKQALAYYAVLQYEESESQHRINFFDRLNDALHNSLKPNIIQEAWAVSELFPLNPLRILAICNILTPLLTMPRLISYIVRKSASVALGGHVLTYPRSKVGFQNLHLQFTKKLKPVYENRILTLKTQVAQIQQLIFDVGGNEEHKNALQVKS